MSSTEISLTVPSYDKKARKMLGCILGIFFMCINHKRLPQEVDAFGRNSAELLHRQRSVSLPRTH